MWAQIDTHKLNIYAYETPLKAHIEDLLSLPLHSLLCSEPSASTLATTGRLCSLCSCLSHWLLPCDVLVTFTSSHVHEHDYQAGIILLYNQLNAELRFASTSLFLPGKFLSCFELWDIWFQEKFCLSSSLFPCCHWNLCVFAAIPATSKHLIKSFDLSPYSLPFFWAFCSPLFLKISLSTLPLPPPETCALL